MMKFSLRDFVVLLIVCSAFSSVYAADQPTATSGIILAAEGNPDPHYNVIDGQQQTNLFTGSSTYSYPIQVPLGVNGLAPQIALGYNSQGYKGPAGWGGVGWSLSGLGQIERSTKTGIPNYTSNDTFLLDGQELVGVGGGFYKSKIYDYRRIEDKGGYWIVTDKSGTRYRYGYNNDSKIEAVGRNGSVRLWALDNVTDTHGNSIEVSYDEDTVNGDYYLANITYNTGNNLTALRTVEFVLENRSDTSIDYSYGSLIKNDKRLKWIEVKYNGSLVRKYGLTYTTGGNNSRSLLESIRLYGSDGNSSLPPTNFSYQQNGKSWNLTGGYYKYHADDENPDWEVIQGDPTVNSDGIWDIPIDIKYWNRFVNSEGTQDNYYEKGRLVDLNSDGWDDLVSNGGGAYINNHNGWSANATWNLPMAFAGAGGPSGSKDLGVRLSDVNGDGLTDIMQNDGSTNNVYLNNGNGWNLTNWTLPTNFVDGNGNEMGVRFGELNGDGLLDIIRAYHYWDYDDYTGSCGGNESEDPGFHSIHNYYYYVWINNGSAWNQVNESGYWSTDLECYCGNCTESSSGNPNVNSDGIWDLPDYIFYKRNYDGVLKEAFDQGRLVDVNGDGLADYLGNSGRTVYLNNGSAWNHESDWNIPVSFYVVDDYKMKDTGARTIDLNGDGLTDIMTNSGGAYVNNGSGWKQSDWSVPTSSVNGNGQSLGVAYGNINGDGIIDTIQSYNIYSFYSYFGGGYDKYDEYYKKIWFSNSTIPDLLSQVRSSGGGLTNFTYNASTQYNNTGDDGISDLHFSSPVLTKMVVDNGMTSAHYTNSTTTYSYEGGLYNPDDKEFRGFNYVKEVNPWGTSSEHYFHQDEAMKGKEYTTQVNDSGGAPYAKTVNQWNWTNSSGILEVLLNQTDSYTYDGNASDPKVTRSLYDYDAYGNVIKSSVLGDISISGDEKYSYSQYVYNTSAWILGKVNHSVLKDSDDSTTVQEAWYYYDGHGLDEAPTKGDLTKEVYWLDTGSNPVTGYEYDVYGNLVNATDPLNRSTVTTYDFTNIFPNSTINPLGYQANFTYEPGTGNLINTTDPNGFTTSYDYDVLGRVVKEIREYDAFDYPTLNYIYYLDGTAPEGTLVSQREENGTSNTLDSLTFVDGFGRTIQMRRDAENPTQQVVQDTFYNEIGKVEKQSVPYYGSYSTSYSSPVSVRNISYEYDPIGRVNYTENTDGTNRTAEYDHWNVADTDENGNIKKKFMDSHGRIVRVQEFNGNDTYNTTYSYDTLDNLVNITDNEGNVFRFYYDSLGRKTSMDDPDLGVWNYSYDIMGNLLNQTDARGTTISFEYDGLNRITKEVRSSDGNTTYVYDQGTFGTLYEVNTSFSSTHNYYDNRLRKTKEVMGMDGISWTTLWTYDSADRVSTQTEPDGTIQNFTYNNQGQVESLVGRMSNVDYNAQEKITRKDYSNSLYTTYVYSEDDFRLSSIVTSDLQNFSYTYDSVGNVMSIVDSVNASPEETVYDYAYNKTTIIPAVPPVVQSFAYDDLDRLASATESDGGYSRDYTYNSIGNLLSIVGDEKNWTFEYGNGTKVPHAITKKYTTPVMSLVSPVDDFYTNETWALLNWTATDDDDDTLTFTTYGDTSSSPSTQIYSGTNDSYNWSSRPDDVYYWKVNMTDGYTSHLSDTRKLTIDLVPPTISITNLDNISQIIEWQADDNHGLDHFTISYNSTNLSKGLVYYDIFDELEDGTYNVTVTAFDRAGSSTFDYMTLVKNTSGANPDAEILIFSKYIDYYLSPGETMAVEIYVFNRGVATLEDGIRIDVRDGSGWPIETKWERIIVPGNDMLVHQFEYTLSESASSGVYSVRAMFTEDQKIEPASIRWFNIGGGE